jgi:hypothetical protein
LCKYYAKAFSGNKFPDFFRHHKEVSNTNLCKIDINKPLIKKININKPVHLDSEKTRFAFYAVIGTEHLQGMHYF